MQLPLALAHLGNPAFGLWLALAGLVWTLGILDCGLGFAVQNRITALVALFATPHCIRNLAVDDVWPRVQAWIESRTV